MPKGLINTWVLRCKCECTIKVKFEQLTFYTYHAKKCFLYFMQKFIILVKVTQGQEVTEEKKWRKCDLWTGSGSRGLVKKWPFFRKTYFLIHPKKLNIKLLKCRFLLQKHIYLNMPSVLEGINKYRFFYKQMQTESWN